MIPERVTPAELERIRERHSGIDQDELLEITPPTEGAPDGNNNSPRER